MTIDEVYGSLSTDDLRQLRRAFLKDLAGGEADAQFAEARVALIDRLLHERKSQLVKMEEKSVEIDL